MPNKYALAMITTDRNRKDRVNYVFDTIKRMKSSGVFDSELLERLVIVIDNTNEKFMQLMKSTTKGLNVEIMQTARQMGSAGAASIAHKRLRHIDADWYMVMEDDLDFCNDFLNVVDTWLAKNYNPKRLVYLLGVWRDYINNYSKSNIDYVDFFGHDEKGTTKTFQNDTPTKLMRGSQCYVMRPNDSISFQSYLERLTDQSKYVVHHDMRIRHWLNTEAMKRNDKEYAYVRAPSPHSFVDHVGIQSSVYEVKQHLDPQFYFKKDIGNETT